MYMSRLHFNVSHICNYIYIYNIINNGLFLEQEAILFQKESKCCPGLKEEAADFWKSCDQCGSHSKSHTGCFQ